MSICLTSSFLFCSVLFPSSAPLVDFRPSQPNWSLHESHNDAASPDAPAVSRSDLVHLSNLSYLPYPVDDSKLVKDVSAVIGWFDSITHVGMVGHQPMYTPLEVPEYYSSSPASSGPAAPLRPDSVVDVGLEKSLLSNAAFKHRGFFVVPKSGRPELEDS